MGTVRLDRACGEETVAVNAMDTFAETEQGGAKEQESKTTLWFKTKDIRNTPLKGDNRFFYGKAGTKPEYVAIAERKPSKKTFALVGGVNVTVNLLTGETALDFTAITSEDGRSEKIIKSVTDVNAFCANFDGIKSKWKNFYSFWAFRQTKFVDKSLRLVDFNARMSYNSNKITWTPSVCDARSGKASYRFDAKNRLTSVALANGREIRVTYDTGGRIARVTSSDGERADLTYQNEIGAIARYSTAGEIRDGKAALDHIPTPISKAVFRYEKDVTTVEYVNDHTEQYRFRADGTLSEYYEERGGVVVNAERYFDSGAERRIEYAKRDSLYRLPLERYEFQKGCEKIVTLNEFGQPSRIEATAVKLGEGFPVRSRVTYFYDEEHRIVRRTESFTYSAEDAEPTVRVTEYAYLPQGQLRSARTYVVGEESAASAAEYTYNEQGKVVCVCFGAQSEPRFYAENECYADGRLKARKNETGEDAVTYTYRDRTDSVAEESYLNDGRMACIRNASDDRLASLTYSFPDLSFASVEFGYTHGKLTKSRNGNTTVKYVYNERRELSAIDVADKENYVRYEYSYGAEKDKFVKTLIARSETSSGERFEREQDKHGNVLTTVYNGAVQVSNEYENGRLVKSFDGVSKEAERYAYDGLGRMVKYARGDYEEGYEYNAFGLLSAVTVNGKGKYVYSYTDDSTRTLKRVTASRYEVEYAADANGRLKQATIKQDGKRVLSELIRYGVSGMRNTNMIAELRFSGVQSGVVYDHMCNYKYIYDANGRLVEVYKNNDRLVRYFYDEADRLVRESNERLSATTEYSYDPYGNIIRKRIGAYTLAIDPKYDTEVYYGYDRDELLTYNGEPFAYDRAGNPTTYRGKSAVWEKGSQLKTYNGVMFRYDGKGRRIKKGNISFTYDGRGDLVSQSNGLEFLYDAVGVIGVKYAGNLYYYRKDFQGNVLALLSGDGNVVAEYVYDAWGKHIVLDGHGRKISLATHIGNLNPFRYRGYYYDAETGLYCIESRYYDPELCRFMTVDNIENIKRDPLCGHNLYAFCRNNPVMAGESAIDRISESIL